MRTVRVSTKKTVPGPKVFSGEQSVTVTSLRSKGQRTVSVSSLKPKKYCWRVNKFVDSGSPFTLFLWRLATCDLRLASCDLRLATCDLRLRIATCDLRLATCDLRLATCDLRLATCDLRLATCDRLLLPEQHRAAGVSSAEDGHNDEVVFHEPLPVLRKADDGTCRSRVPRILYVG